MKYQFDYFEIEVTNQNHAKVYVLGSKNSKDYEIFLKEKSWSRRIASAKDARNINDIILKRPFNKIHISVMETNDEWYKFVASGIRFGWLIHNRSNQFAYVSKTTFDRLVQEIQKQ